MTAAAVALPAAAAAAAAAAATRQMQKSRYCDATGGASLMIRATVTELPLRLRKPPRRALLLLLLLLHLLPLVGGSSSAAATNGETRESEQEQPVINRVVPLRNVASKKDAARKMSLNTWPGDSSTGSDGSELSYTIDLGGSTINFRLKPTAISPASVPIYTSHKEGGVVRLNLPSDESDLKTTFYHDMNMTASFAATEATVTKDGVVGHLLEGTFVHHGVLYSLRPSGSLTSGSTSRRATKLRSAETSPVHEVRRVPLPPTRGDYDPDMRAPLDINHVSRLTANRVQQSAGRGRRAAGVTYTIDMLYVIDFALFKKFLQYESTSDPLRIQNAYKQIRYYFCFVANAVDQRYASISYMSWNMRARLTGLYIATDASASPWTEDAKQNVSERSRTVVNASLVIENFNNWLLQYDNTSVYDHAVLFSGYDIYKVIQGVTNYDVVGLAYVAGACTDQRTAVVEASGSLNEGETHAHELGHNLNAQHDGDMNNCSSADHYIMATMAEATNNETHDNFFRFSNCSLSSFDTFLNYLNSASENCFLDERPLFNETEYNVYMRLQPGQRYNASVQCQQALGNTWTACGGATYGKQICTALWCHDGSSLAEGCQTAIGGARGAEGTTCGNHKWCQLGHCVYNASAPTASDTCPLGETTAKVYNNYDYTCRTMPASFCYQTYVTDKCCETCPKLRNSSNVGCEFGDHVTNCSGAMRISDCYDAGNRNLCCSYCQKHRSTAVGCEWGDLYEDCASLTAESGFCYGNDSASCCRSCLARYNPLDAACRYGDMSDSQCVNITLADCDAGANTACCGTCNRLSAAAVTLTTSIATSTRPTTVVTSTTIATTGATNATVTTTKVASATVTTTLTTATTNSGATTRTTARGNDTTTSLRVSNATSATTLQWATTTTPSRYGVSWRSPTLRVRSTYPPRTIVPPWSAADSQMRMPAWRHLAAITAATILGAAAVGMSLRLC